MGTSAGEVYLFDDFRLHVSERLLYLDGELVPLTPKQADTLTVLVRARGSLVPKDQLLREVWQGTFVEDASLTQTIWMLRKALRQAPERVFIETVPKRGYRFSRPIAEAALPVTAEESVQTPRACAAPVAAVAAAPQGPRAIRRIWLGLPVALAVAGAVAFAIFRSPVPSGARRSLAVIGFRNLAGGAEDWRSTALTEMFTTELSAGSGLRTIAGERVARLRLELPASGNGSLSKDTLARIRRNLGCDLVLAGSYLSMGGKFRVDIHLIDAASGETAATFTQTGDEAALLDVVASAGNRLREGLGLAPASPADQKAMRASAPANPEALRLYADGLSRLRRFDAPAAQAKLAEAVAADPAYPPTHSALSEAWSMLGYDGRARSEAKTAFDLSGRLAREDGLAVEGRYRQAEADWAQAIDVYRSLWKFYPDNVEYALLLASAQVSAGQGRQALGTVREMRQKQLAAGDARLDLAEASAAASLGDFHLGLTAARRAVRLAQSGNAALLEARASLEAGRNLFHLADPQHALEEYRRAQQLCSAVGDRGGVAESLNHQGSLLRSQGDLESARREFEQALAIERPNGDRRRTIQSLTGLAGIRRSLADMSGSQALFEQVLDLAREIEDRRTTAVTLVNLGNVLNNSGHPDLARQRYREAVQLAGDIGDRHQTAIAMNNLAVLAYTEGDLAGARKSLEEVLSLKRQIGDRSSYAYTLSHYGNVLEFQGDLAGARKAWKEQREIQSATSEKIYLANCELGLAELDMEDGHPEMVEGPARKVIAAFHTVNPAADAWRLLALASLRLGDLNKARDAAGHAVQLARQTSNVADYKLPIAIVTARVDAAFGRKTQATASLIESLHQATALRLMAPQLEARLALAEIQKDPAQTAALLTDARRMGYRLIAAKSARLRN
jgi:DNA-binding winged helix-turn-helix (wHTH) protein/tetratricopeptide (TPR) repeat protein